MTEGIGLFPSPDDITLSATPSPKKNSLSVAEIIAASGINAQKVRNLLFLLKKIGKIESVG